MLQQSNKINLILTVLISTLLLSGCGSVGAQTIAQVTPLPDDALTPDAETATPATAETPVPATPTAALVAQAATPAATATPLPLSNDLPAGEAAAIAFAADQVMKPEIENPIVFDEIPVPLTFDEFYDGFSIRHGLLLSEKLQSLDGIEVTMEGYMAPPLKPDIDWFVLTSVRLEFCPFCSSAADWPDDIALVYLMGQEVDVTTKPMRLTGQLELGASVDPETGMVSLVRIYATSVEEIDF